MRENRPYGSEGGEGNLPDPYPPWGREIDAETPASRKKAGVSCALGKVLPTST
jgi:hypothetical protein